MSVFIVESLQSKPPAVRPGQSATLELVLQSTIAAGEEATVEYRLNPKNEVLFAENDDKVITASFNVASVPAPTARAYALKAKGGNVVTITAIVLPERVQKSKEAVTILK